MTFDYYAFLSENSVCPVKNDLCNPASGFGNGCTVWSCREGEKNNARQCYIKRAAAPDLTLFKNLGLDPELGRLPVPSWFGIEVSFTLISPWYSKDDRSFHVMDNPVRKDRVFGAPFMSASSWKGMLRWACRMQAGLYEHLDRNGMKMDGWTDKPWIKHLFGNEKEETENFRAGNLVCYPTWFNKIGFEVINPHSRTRRAGTQPIYYEVVPPDTKGKLRLLYAPMPGGVGNDEIRPADFVNHLIDSITALLQIYGISAKRTAGWGTALINNNGWKAVLGSGESFVSETAESFKREMAIRTAGNGGVQ